MNKDFFNGKWVGENGLKENGLKNIHLMKRAQIDSRKSKLKEN